MLLLPHAKHNIAYYSSKCDEISKVHKLKIKKKNSLIHDAKLSLLEILLHFLVDYKIVYIKTVMKTRTYKYCLTNVNKRSYKPKQTCS